MDFAHLPHDLISVVIDTMVVSSSLVEGLSLRLVSRESPQITDLATNL